jgi:hypothetical protein
MVFKSGLIVGTCYLRMESDRTDASSGFRVSGMVFAAL